MGQLGDLSPAASIAIGIFVGLLSTSIQSLGLTLQRKSHLLEDEKENEFVRRPPYRRRRWQIGMFMFVVANLVGSTIQITTLPLPVLSTLQASGLVFNTICATLILGEPFTTWSLGGTILVAGGAVLIALFGALPEPSHSLVQLLELLGRQQFILWMVGTLILIIAIGVAAWALTRVKGSNRSRIRLWRGMCFGSISAILSAHSLLIAKSAVELLVRTIVDGVNQFNRWQSWMILLSLVFFALTQLYFLHRGLKLCSTSVLYPFVFCIYNIIAIMDGLIYFHQTDRLPPLHAGLIGVGTLILLLGVLALSWRLEEATDLPTPDAHSLLTPGMGMVDDITEESEDVSVDADAPSDELTPLLLQKRRPSGRTGLTKDGSLTRLGNARRQTSTDANEIWDEFHDTPSPINFQPTIREPRRAVTMAGDIRFGYNEDTAVESVSNGRIRFPIIRSGTANSFREQGRRRDRRLPPRLRSVSTPNAQQITGRDTAAVSPLWWLGVGWFGQRPRPDESPSIVGEADTSTGRDEES